MKNLLVAAVLVVAACSGQKPGDAPAEPGVVTLATFTGEVDPVAGTITIRTDQAPAELHGRTGMTIPEGSSTVTIANSGSAWNGTTSPTSACGGATVTGANVVVTQRYASPAFLGAVYAEIVILSGTGAEACNSAAAPTGLSASKGLWFYGTLNADSPSATREWDFSFTSSQKTTFSGRIVAVRGDTFTTSLPADAGWAYSMDYNGVNMVYGSGATSNLVFANLDGSYSNLSDALPAQVMSVRADTSSGRIWFTTDNDGLSKGWAGYLASGGTGVVSGKPSENNSPNLDAITVDPDDPAKAWFYGSQSGLSTIWSITVGSPPTFSSFAGGGAGNGLAIGADKNIYLTHYGANTIQKYSRAGALIATYTTPTGCRGPGYIMRNASDGNLWFTAGGDAAVCSMTTGGSFTAEGAVPNARALVLGPSNQVWSTNMGAPPSAYRIIRGDPTYAVQLGGAWSIGGIAASPDIVGPPAYPAAVWVRNGSYGLVRLQP
jgi:uncharacterized Zn-binding protein involved in type VI secretion